VYPSCDEDRGKQNDDTHRENQPQLFRDHRENKIRVRLGQKIQLLASLPQPRALCATGGKRRQRLVQLIRPPHLVALDIEKRGETPRPVGIQRNHHSKQTAHGQQGRDDVAPASPRQK